MTRDIYQFFEDNADFGHGENERVLEPLPEFKLTDCSDIAMFLLMERLVPGSRSIVAAAGHDQIWLGVDIEKVNEAATDDELLTMIAHGVFIDEDSFSMFV